MVDLGSFASLESCLSPPSKVYTKFEDEDSEELLKRWSDIDRKTPAAVVQPGSEEDVALVVRFANTHGIPFVPKSGGHSLWSTIGSDGFVMDLSLLKTIAVNESTRVVTLQSGVLIQQASSTAVEHGLCLALGQANTVGVVPMALGGGLSPLSSVCGYTADTILSARLVTADGSIVEVSPSSEPELFWGIRGAGQFFGIVTQITIQAFPLSILGTDDATVWTGSILFPHTRLQEVLAVMEPLIKDRSAPSSGLFLISSLGNETDPVIIILPTYLGSAPAAEAFFKPLLALEPKATNLSSIPYSRMNDSVDPFCTKGEFKRFATTGATAFKKEPWQGILERYMKLKEKCPDASKTSYGFEWNAYVPKSKPKDVDTAFSHKDIQVWVELLSWYTNPSSHEVVSESEQETLAYFRSHYDGEREATYQNFSRDEPLECYYQTPEKIERLKALKRRWDPNGVFTRILL